MTESRCREALLHICLPMLCLPYVCRDTGRYLLIWSRKVYNRNNCPHIRSCLPISLPILLDNLPITYLVHSTLSSTDSHLYCNSSNFQLPTSNFQPQHSLCLSIFLPPPAFTARLLEPAQQYFDLFCLLDVTSSSPIWSPTKDILTTLLPLLLLPYPLAITNKHSLSYLSLNIQVVCPHHRHS